MSLLALFFNQIKSSQEDIASEGLRYILQNSDFAKSIIKSQIKSKTSIDLPELNYVSQVSKKGLGRTDISGIDINGNEIIIFESKFWASLTENQPVSYLNRIKNNSVLLFICPSLRKSSLYIELSKKLFEQNIKFESDESLLKFELENCKFILIQSWLEILDPIKTILKVNNQDNLVSDIDQIIGFCETIDKNSFIPLNDKDLSPEIGRKISSYYELTDEVISELSKSEYYKQEKLTEWKPSKEYGYYKYRLYDGYAISFGLNFGYWAKFADTPFWLRVSEWPSFKQEFELKNKLKSISSMISKPIFESDSNDLFFPIYPTKYNDKSNVIKNMIEQIDVIFNELRKTKI
jgi:hypothetical protein